MAGFDVAGLSGCEYIRESLSNCGDSSISMFLESFQQDNGILLPSLHPALPLLDLHDIPRYQFHHTVMENLREKLISRLDVISNEKLNQLLEQSFSFIRIPALRPVIMDMLKRLKTVPNQFIEVLANEPELYESCSLEVKRQIWVKHQPLFGDAVGPLLNDYLKDKNSVIFNTDELQDFLSMVPKVRRQHSVVQQLAKMIGRSLELYNLVLQFLRTLFLRTKEAHYCTLRAELLMAIHDLDIKEIKDVDPCHKFIWCLDACVRSHLIDSKKIKDLKGYMKAARGAEEQVLGDIAMVLCDPFAINVIAKSIIKVLHHLVTTEALPRTSTDLTFLLSILQLGLGAWTMIDSQVFNESSLSNDLIVRFLPIVMATVAEDSLYRIEKKLPDKKPKDKIPLHHSFEQSLSEYSICFTIAFYLCLHMVKQKHKHALSSLLPTISSAYSNHHLHDGHLHSLITLLASWQDEYTNNEVCEIIFDHFLLKMVNQESVLRHTLRLLHFIHTKMDANKVVAILTATQPLLDNEEVNKLHASIVFKAAGNTSTTPGLSSMEQPLSASSSGNSASSSPLNYLPPSSV